MLFLATLAITLVIEQSMVFFVVAFIASLIFLHQTTGAFGREAYSEDAPF